MKHNHNHDNAPSACLQLMPVHFEFTHPTATHVSVAGCFNHWKPKAKTLHPAGGGRWLKDTALPPGNYEYCFVVDGQWMPDPRAQESMPNPFSGRNSVLKVISPEAIHLEAAENVPLKTPTNKKKKPGGMT